MIVPAKNSDLIRLKRELVNRGIIKEQFIDELRRGPKSRQALFQFWETTFGDRLSGMEGGILYGIFRDFVLASKVRAAVLEFEQRFLKTVRAAQQPLILPMSLLPNAHPMPESWLKRFLRTKPRPEWAEWLTGEGSRSHADSEDIDKMQEDMTRLRKDIQTDMSARRNAIRSLYDSYLYFSGEKAAIQYGSEFVAETSAEKMGELVALLPSKLRKLLVKDVNADIRRLMDVLDRCDEVKARGGKIVAAALTEVFDTLEAQSGTAVAETFMEYYYEDVFKDLPEEVRRSTNDNLSDKMVRTLMGPALTKAFFDAVTSEAKEQDALKNVFDGLSAGGDAAERVFDFFHEALEEQIKKGHAETVSTFLEFYYIVKHIENDSIMPRFVKRLFPMLPLDARKEVAQRIKE